MPLSDLPSVTLTGQQQGAYREPLFSVDGLDGLVTLQELLAYIFNQLGSGGGGTDNFVQSAALGENNVLTLTLNTGGTVTVDLSTLAGGGGSDNFVQSAALDGNNLVLTLADASTVTADLSALAGGGSGLSQYQASGVNGAVDNGCFLTATATGATYERVGGAGQNTEGTLTVPSGAILRGVAVHFSAAQAPGNTFFLNIDYQDTGKAVNGSQDSVMPMIATVASKPAVFGDATPATNFVHSGTPLQVGIAQVADNGTRTRVRLKITNYNQQVGPNASILSVVLP